MNNSTNKSHSSLKKKILIIGGYGRAGRAISRLLASYNNYEIITAGRTLAKAQCHAEQLKEEFPKGVFTPIELDVTNYEQLRTLVAGVDLVIAVIPLNYQTTISLIDAVLQSKYAHYIDLSPDTDKHKAFDKRRLNIEESQHVFIMDAGFEPGLPGFMAHNILYESDPPETLTIEGIYRDSQIPEGSIKDIIDHNEPAYILRKGKLKKAAVFKVKLADFPYGFGKALCVPIWVPELQSIPSTYKLKNMQYYHAGFNGIANFVLLSWKLIFNKFLPIDRGISLFRWAIQSFTKKPFGGVIRAKVKSSDFRQDVIISHNELYEATAIPVAATAFQVLNNISNKGGLFFMGQFVEHKTFLKDIKNMGMNVSDIRR